MLRLFPRLLPCLLTVAACTGIREDPEPGEPALPAQTSPGDDGNAGGVSNGGGVTDGGAAAGGFGVGGFGVGGFGVGGFGVGGFGFGGFETGGADFPAGGAGMAGATGI